MNESRNGEGIMQGSMQSRDQRKKARQDQSPQHQHQQQHFRDNFIANNNDISRNINQSHGRSSIDGILWRTGTTTSSSTTTTVVARRHHLSLDSILWRRQTLGRTMVRPGTLSSQLASMAWNPDRMHNLILVTGPGTPASILYAANLRRRASRSEPEHAASEDAQEEEEKVDVNDREDDDDDDSDGPGDIDMEEEEEGGDDTARFAWRSLGLGDMDDGEEDDDDDSDVDSTDVGMMNAQLDEMIDFIESQAPPGMPGIYGRLEAIHDVDGEAEQGNGLLYAALPIQVPQQHFYSNRRSAAQPNTANHDTSGLNWKPDIRHGGCINTACWMTVPWRLAAPAGTAASQNSNRAPGLVEDQWGGLDHCPTQLATSGDDRVVKFWDARNAMGTANPLPGGWDTFCPLSSTERPSQFQSAWIKYYQNNPTSAVAGSVVPLATVATGHRGNVFDIAPLPHQAGKLLTCAADGYLRLVDVQAQSSSVIIDPNQTHGREEHFHHHSGLAFSHTLLNAHTGLLCSDRGLHLFDLRLSPREQARKSLLADSTNDNTNDNTTTTPSNNTDISLDSFTSSHCCKACAVWRPSAAETESHYVFAGGSSAVVGLYDLRVDGSRRQVVECYKPRFVRETGDVSVSGLDVSKDGRELLVSYESDQIYAFPIMGRSSSPAGPTLDDIESLAAVNSANRKPVADAIAYGGHLNRFTFLKNARYAGPNDDYICTGSDSGHAWIMERGTGTVVSLLSADASTCNGVVPHPSLPFFITYGIDSTARLWRATVPVDSSVNDSRQGRALCAHNDKFEMSPVAQSPKMVQMLCTLFKKTPGILPDFIAARQEIASSGKFSAPNRRGMVDYDSPRIGNSYRSLPSILRSNRYECYRTAQTEMPIPIDEYGLRSFSLRVALCRLRHQAQRLGVSFSFQSHQPWNFQNVGDDTHPADLVPDSPSDWIFLDERMTPNPLRLDQWYWNWKDWSDYLLTRNDDCSSTSSNHLLKEFAEQQEDKRYSLWNDPPVWLQRSSLKIAQDEEQQDDDTFVPWPVLVRNTGSTTTTTTSNTLVENSPNGCEDDDSDDDDEGAAVSEAPPRRSHKNKDAAMDDDDGVHMNDNVVFCPSAQGRSQRYLYETALLLKEGGNTAMKEGHLDAAARRYDKSIQYCSVAFLGYREGRNELDHLKQQQQQCSLSSNNDNNGDDDDVVSGGRKHQQQRLHYTLPVTWSPLLRVLITARLNMALLLLKPRMLAVADASMHALEALRLLSPFTVRSGAVMIIPDLEQGNEERFIRTNEPEETYQQARALQAKAYFRLGSAEMERGDWSAAVDAFQASIGCSEKEPDSLITRRLHEAKIKRNSKKKRDRRRFEVAISEETNHDNNHRSQDKST